MMRNKLLAICLVLLLAASCSAEGPLKIKAKVNGVDPQVSVGIVTAGETTYAELDIMPPAEGGITVNNIVFASYPGVLGSVMNNLVERRIKFPFTQSTQKKIQNIDLPWYTPSGLYEVTAYVHYTHNYQRYKDVYKFRIRVNQTGLISRILGFGIKIVPQFITNKLIDAFFMLFG
ncbi:hypothetical protein ACFLRF_04210 [Candidatus Altiarchaeota archaeon]